MELNADAHKAEGLSIEKTPTEFSFPFEPYTIQLNFMKNLYHVLDNKKFGIFESPTGTGKSLSLICGILKWFYDNKQKELNTLEKNIDELEIEKNKNISEDWIEQQSYELKIRNQIDELKNVLKAQNDYEKYIEAIRKQAEKRKKSLKCDQVELHALSYKSKYSSNKEESSEESVEQFSEVSEYIKEITEDDDMLLDENTSCEDSCDESIKEGYKDIKIFFCSRTHSQLSQFVKEINKTIYKNQLRITCLSSRQNYCINESVNQLKNINLINEKCIELSKNSKKTTKVDENEKITKKKKCATSSSCCIYKNETKIEQLKNEILSNIHDIEEVVNEGKIIKACPYYSSRAAIQDSQMIVVPYNILLHKTTREMCNIQLKDSVIVIDEAHNLLDIIESIYSASINGESLYNCYNQMNNYKMKFLSKFNSHNLLFINQIIYLLKMFLIALNFKYLIEKKKSFFQNRKNPSEMLHLDDTMSPSRANQIKEDSKISTLSDFLMDNNIDNINIFKLLEFIKQSKLCYKLQNYSMKYKDCLKPMEQKNEMKKENDLTKSKLSGLQTFLKNAAQNQTINNVDENKTENKVDSVNNEEGVRNPMLSIVTFLEVLVNKNEDGRILVTKNTELNKSFIKYILLNPANHFNDIVEQARSIIVAGGTMEPISEFKDQLFGSLGVSNSRIHHFSCGHVIPKENILPLVLCNGPSNKKLELTFENRMRDEILKEVAMTITNLTHIVPKGVVCFFPSYEYENIVYNFMKTNNFIDRISNKKKIFREPKKTSDVDKILTEYAKSIETLDGGAIMFSVIGGKLSEGLNFTNDLGRCVIVIGMPYANIKSLYIKEKIQYLNDHVGNGAGQIYYKNSCMKGVNQSIGRAIRHANDYACMVLLDHRYSQLGIQQLLPNWIQQHLTVHENFGHMFRSVKQFFQNK